MSTAGFTQEKIEGISSIIQLPLGRKLFILKVISKNDLDPAYDSVSFFRVT